MKLFKRLFLCIVLALCSLYTSAYDFTAVNDGNTICYNITSSNDRTCSVTYRYELSTSSNGLFYLGKIVIPSSVKYNNTTYLVTGIGSHAFFDCSNLTSITIPESVTSIGNYAFYKCSSLTSVTIGSSVTSIGDYAFSYCSSLTSIDIPNSVTSIQSNAFRGCSSLTSITIPESVTSIGSYAFRDCSSLTSITIPESVTSIGSFAFNECTSLTSITIPEGVTSIGFYAFANCTSLTSITIPEGVTRIEWSTFRECSSLTSVTIPNSVIIIESDAFYGCTSLSEITSLNPEPPTCASNTFGNVNTSTCKLYVPEGSHDVYATAYQWKNFLQIEEMDATPVIGIEAKDEVKELYRYTIDGKKIDGPQKGINIIKYSDGTTKKVVVK